MHSSCRMPDTAMETTKTNRERDRSEIDVRNSIKQ